MRHAFLVCVTLLSYPALAETIVVDGTSCTLTDAILAANYDGQFGGCPAGDGADVIELTTDVTLTSVWYVSLSGPNGLPSLWTDVVIEGRGHTIRRAVDAPPFRLLFINYGADVNINELTLENGKAGGVPPDAFFGGGIAVQGYLELRNSTVKGNHTAWDVAGGISVGGAVGATAVVTNSTVSGNGGGISVSGPSASLSLWHSTIVGNQGYGLAVAGYADVQATIIAGHEDSNCLGENIDLGDNYSDDPTCGDGFAPVLKDVDFDMDLADNGGPTWTHALLPGSNAANVGGFCGLPRDQRGVPRGLLCDAGAFEIASVAEVPPPVPDGSQAPPVRWSRADPSGSSVDLTWSVSLCPAAGYHMVYGDLSEVASYLPLGGECDLGNAGSAEDVFLPAGDLWMLVVSDDDWQTEGSWGRAMGGERNGTAASGTCGFVWRDNVGTCP